MNLPIALLRALIVATVVGGIGVGLLLFAHSQGEVQRTITDVAGDAERVNIVWWATSGFIGCVAALSGLVAGGLAVVDQTLHGPGRAITVVGLPLAVWLAGGLLLVDRGGWLATGTTLPLGFGLAIGLAAAAVYLVYRGGVDDPYATFQSGSSDHGRSWGSR